MFADQWDSLPVVMKDHYAIRAFSDDTVKVEGKLDITISPLVSLLARLSGTLVAYSGKDVPVTVLFRSDRETGSFHLVRTFHYPDKGNVRFHSRMEPVGANELIEVMRFGIGWKTACVWDRGKVVLSHRGYAIRIFGLTLPIPLELVIGRGYAEEVALSDRSFAMATVTRHRLLGETFSYSGEFTITETTCGEKS